MLDGKYSLALQTELGGRTGELDVAGSGEAFCGTLRMFGITHDVSGVMLEGGGFEFEVVMQLPFRKRTLRFEGLQDGDRLSGFVKLGIKTLRFSGVREHKAAG